MSGKLASAAGIRNDAGRTSGRREPLNFINEGFEHFKKEVDDF